MLYEYMQQRWELFSLRVGKKGNSLCGSKEIKYVVELSKQDQNQVLNSECYIA